MQKEFTVKDEQNMLNYLFLWQHHKKNLENLTLNEQSYQRLEKFAIQDKETLYLAWLGLPTQAKVRICKSIANLHIDKKDVFRKEVLNQDMIEAFEEMLSSLDDYAIWIRYQKQVQRALRENKKQQPNASLINRIIASRKAYILFEGLINSEKKLNRAKHISESDEIRKIIELSKAEESYYRYCYEFINFFKLMNDRQKNRFFRIVELNGEEALLKYAKQLTGEEQMLTLLNERKHSKSTDQFEKFLDSEY